MERNVLRFKAILLVGRTNPPNIRLDEDVLKTSFVFVFRRCLQDQYIRLGYTSSRRLQDVFKTSSRYLQDVLQKRLQDVF